MWINRLFSGVLPFTLCTQHNIHVFFFVVVVVRKLEKGKRGRTRLVPSVLISILPSNGPHVVPTGSCWRLWTRRSPSLLSRSSSPVRRSRVLDQLQPLHCPNMSGKQDSKEKRKKNLNRPVTRCFFFYFLFQKMMNLNQKQILQSYCHPLLSSFISLQ